MTGDQKQELSEKIKAYRDAVIATQIALAVLVPHDYTELLRAIEHADAFGPLLDPTLWRDKQKAMNEDRKMLEAARAFVEAVRIK